MIARQVPILATALVFALPAWSQTWSPTTGVPVCGDCSVHEPHVTADGAGGFYVTWTELRDYATTDYDVYVQRITASGQVAPGWPVTGVSLCSLPLSQSPRAIAPDGAGGVFVAWYESRGTSLADVYVQRVRGDGTLAPGWPVNGAPASRAPESQIPEIIVPDGLGGAYVLWEDARVSPTQNRDIYAQHLTASGEVAAGWPADGLAVALTHMRNFDALSDGAGGVVIVWDDQRSYFPPHFRREMYATRLLPDGTIAPGWTANNSFLFASRVAPRVAPDHAGGFYVVSSAVPVFTDVYEEHWVDRFTFSGARAAGWPEAGVLVCGAAGTRTSPSVAPDGLGGLLLAWPDSREAQTREIFASRVLPDASLAPGWTPDGVPVSLITGGNSGGPQIVGDGAGGAYVTWEWFSYSVSVRNAMVQRLTGQGGVAAGWPTDGMPASTSPGQQGPHVVTDGAGGAIVVWDEGSPLYAQRFSNTPTPVLLSLASASATPERVVLRWGGEGAGMLAASVYRRDDASDWQRLGAAIREGDDLLAYEDRALTAGTRYAYRLGYVEAGLERFTAETWVDVPLGTRFALRGPNPNPSAGNPSFEFSLVSHEPGSLTVHDVRGRLVFSREVGILGPGTHQLSIGGPARLPAGIYSVRLRQGALTAVARAIVMR